MEEVPHSRCGVHLCGPSGPRPDWVLPPHAGKHAQTMLNKGLTKPVKPETPALTRDFDHDSYVVNYFEARDCALKQALKRKFSGSALTRC